MKHEKRLRALEQRVQVATDQPMQIIGTALAVTANEPHTTTDNNMVTFHAASLREAFAMREAWLAEQKNTIVLTSPFDTGDRVLEVLAEKHDRLEGESPYRPLPDAGGANP